MGIAMVIATVSAHVMILVSDTGNCNCNCECGGADIRNGNGRH